MKTKKTRLVYLLAVMGAFLMLSTACNKDDDVEPKDDAAKVDTVTNIEFIESRAGLNISWDAVDEAKSYMVSVNGEADSDLPITGIPYKPAADLAEGDEVKVEAFSDPNTSDLIAVGTTTYGDSGSDSDDTDDSDGTGDDTDDSGDYSSADFVGMWSWSEAGEDIKLTSDGEVTYENTKIGTWSLDAASGAISLEIEGETVAYTLDESGSTPVWNDAASGWELDPTDAPIIDTFGDDDSSSVTYTQDELAGRYQDQSDGQYLILNADGSAETGQYSDVMQEDDVWDSNATWTISDGKVIVTDKDGDTEVEITAEVDGSFTLVDDWNGTEYEFDGSSDDGSSDDGDDTGDDTASEDMEISTVSLPGSFEAEHFRNGGPEVGYFDNDEEDHGGTGYREGGVDIVAHDGASNGYRIGWFEGDEALAYDVSIPAGDYIIEVTYSGQGELDFYFGDNESMYLTLSESGSHDTYATESMSFSLSSSKESFFVQVWEPGFDLDKFEIIEDDGSSSGGDSFSLYPSTWERTAANEQINIVSSDIIDFYTGYGTGPSETRTSWTSEFDASSMTGTFYENGNSIGDFTVSSDGQTLTWGGNTYTSKW